MAETQKAKIARLERELEEAKEIIKSIGQEMTEGIVKIRPNKKTDACKYCDYSSICRKNICV